MSVQFKRAIRENTFTLVAFAGSSGSGKTYSALRLAVGLAGAGGTIAFVDTEARRALHYADKFNFLHYDLTAPFSPARYLEAVESAEAAGCKVVVIDSISHEHAGTGGLLEMHDAEFERLGGTDKVNMTAWIKPKREHKRFIIRLLQCRIHVILCFRAEEKLKMEKVDGKTVVIPIGWQPICEKNLPYEMTVSFLLTADRPGFPQPIKLQEQHKALFPLDRRVDEESGKALAAWAAGGKPTEKKRVADSLMDKVRAATNTVELEKMASTWNAADKSKFSVADIAAIDKELLERKAALSQSTVPSTSVPGEEPPKEAGDAVGTALAYSPLTGVRYYAAIIAAATSAEQVENIRGNCKPAIARWRALSVNEHDEVDRLLTARRAEFTGGEYLL